MVDTLVLGTSANAWEFESLHAHILQLLIFIIKYVEPDNLYKLSGSTVY